MLVIFLYKHVSEIITFGLEQLVALAY